jgi:hypothetical protein
MTIALTLLVAAALAGSESDHAGPDLPDVPAPLGVVGGSPVADGSWPDAAAVYWGDNVSCSGVLVAPNVVLTAGHCEGNLTWVTLGTSDYEVGGETLPVAEVYTHPNYLGTYDVTVLILGEDATVPPRAVAMDCVVEDALRVGAPVAVVGFGATDLWAGQWGTVLQEAFTEITDPACEDLDADCNAAISPGGELIAGGDGVDSCSGDSGGPLYLLTPSGDYLVGLTSRGVIPSPTPCGGGGIYVRVDAVVDWIEEMSGETLARPVCEGINRPPSASAAPIALGRGLAGVSSVDVVDPNPGDVHLFAIEEPPERGTASIGASGEVIYVAELGWSGEDRFVVRVEDGGVPVMQTTVEIAVTRAAPPSSIVLTPVACDGTGGRGALGVLALLTLLITRRR